MSLRGTALLRQAVCGGFIVFALMAIFPPMALATVGTVLRTINLPDAAKCDEGFHSPALFNEFGANFGTSQFITTKGIAAAAVQGSKVGHPEYPILLVTSCVSTFATNPVKASSLYFLAPTTETATLVKTINTRTSPTTLFAPPLGWGALVYRPDKGDFLGCGNGGDPAVHPIYSIDISALNTIPDGTVTFLFNARTDSTDLCDGLAWDPSNDTIYEGPDVATTNGITHFSETGTALSTFSTPLLVTETCEGIACTTLELPNRCPKSGLALVGGALFVACDGQLQVHQLDKTTKARIRAFVTPAGTRTEDLECDPITFASQGKDAIWTRDIYPVRHTSGPDAGEPILTLEDNGNVTSTGNQQLFAMEVPAGTCGLPAGPTVLNPAACLVNLGGVLSQDPNDKTDTDGDGLLDCWEKKGLASVWAAANLLPGDGLPATLPGIDFNGDGIRDLVLCVDANQDGTFDEATECAAENIKDIFVEFDTMVDHPANVPALNSVITAFANQGIRLHVQVDDQNIPHKDNTAMPPCTPTPPLGATDADFDNLKATWFGTAAERAFAEPQRANTLFAKRMAYRYGVGVHNLTRQTGTTSPSGCAEVVGNDFIVSLGSFPSGTTTSHKNGTTDQWEGTFMHELGHTLGLRHGGGDNVNCKPNYLSVMSYSRQFKNVITDRPLDFSDRVLQQLNEASLNEAQGVGGALLPSTAKTTYAASTSTTTGTALIAGATGQISWDGDRKTNETVFNIDINKIGSGTGCDGSGTVLVGFDDWANLVYNFRASFDFADGVHSTAEEVQEISEAQTQALYEAADVDGDGIGDANGCGPMPNGGPCMIDIVPGLASNTVVLFDHNGVPTVVVPVAILSTPSFDAGQVNPASLTLNAAPVARNSGGKPACSMKDVNNDKFRDLVCGFVLTGLSAGDEIAVLEGRTLIDTGIRAQDTMHIVEKQF